jgi:hypothetical protein
MTRLGAAGLAGAALACAAAAPASANDVWLWACHGPAGQSLGTAGLVGNAQGDAALNGGCGDGQALAGGFTQAAPSGGSGASVRADVPSGLTLQGVHLGAALAGAGTGEQYTVRTAGDTLQSFALSAPQAPGQDFTVADPQAGGDFALVSLACPPGDDCPAGDGDPAAFSLSALALHVDDSSAPRLSVGGWHSPTAEALTLQVSGTDVGTGLASAQAIVDGVTMASGTFAGSGACADLSPDAAQVDLPLGEDCPRVGTAQLPLNPTTLPDGPHTLVVRVLDAAGNATTETLPLETVHIVPGNRVQTLTVGTSVPAAGGGSGGGSGGVLGASASSCSKPKLSMLLDQKPLRVSHGVPVLKHGKRYRFRGTLSCVVRNHRVAAPKRTRVDFLNRLGKRTLDKGGAVTRAKGRVTFIVTALSTRTLIFRFAEANGRKLDVKIKVKVARR